MPLERDPELSVLMASPDRTETWIFKIKGACSDVRFLNLSSYLLLFTSRPFGKSKEQKLGKTPRHASRNVKYVI